MSTEKALLNESLLLERFPGKGGWTYARLPQFLTSRGSHFGFHKVYGFIDDYPIPQINLMPLGKGQLMITVKAEIRKAIGKAAGDWVNVVLYSAAQDLPVPNDFFECLCDDPLAAKNFAALPETEKKRYLDWIYAVRSDEVIVERMARAINQLALGLMLNH